MEPTPSPSDDLAGWLKEAGKRRRTPEPEADEPAAEGVSLVRRPRGSGAHRKWVVLGAVTAVAYMQYFYADTLLQILKAPAIVFFVLVYGDMPPM